MILRRLQIHNIASISDATLDFDAAPLSGASVFLICGETGAGKTTLLDAICLALYGTTPRMNSVSKEGLDLTEGDSRGRYYTNDNSQLLRRGTGEGFCRLDFTGNDGLDYTAVWEVHRNHDKPEKRLQRPRRSLRAADGSFSDHRLDEIDGKIRELTGLRYEQFCRTVMLAQGDFARFLKSRREDKSEILEKLTGTEIYSRIGIRIAEKYNERRREFDRIDSEIRQVKLLDEEKGGEYRSRLAEIDGEICKLDAAREETVRKSTWLAISEDGRKEIERCATAVEEARKAVESDDFKSDMSLVADYSASADGRRLLGDIRMLESLIGKKRLLRAGIERNAEQAREALKDAAVKSEEALRLVEEVTRRYESYDTAGAASELQALTVRDRVLAEFLKESERSDGLRKAGDIYKEELSRHEGIISATQDELKRLKEALEESGGRLADLRERYMKMELSMSRTVREIRAELKPGDICPVCGEKVISVVTDRFFISVMQPLREMRDKEERAFTELRSDCKAREKILASSEKEVTSLREKIKANDGELRIVALKVEGLKESAGLGDLSPDKAGQEAERERKRLAERIEAIHRIQKEAGECLDGLRKLQESERKCRENVEKRKTAVSDADLALKVWEAEYKVNEAGLEEKKRELDRFLSSDTGISRERLESFAAMDADGMRRLEKRVGEALERLAELKGNHRMLVEKQEKHMSQKPEMDGDDSLDSLRTRLGEIDRDVKAKSGLAGEIRKTLEMDAEAREMLRDKLAQLETAREEVSRWEGLYTRLGDQKGVKFRSVAQSFILRALLDNANRYLAGFTDRYVLTCNPGTLAILVRDNHKPGDPQPASILSGGESFMASLALALALSNLQGAGLGADIIFIDEGFGTLSPEYLANVMDSLEKLHQIGGRRVGLISHVPDMKERIPVHINVVRDNLSKSHVEVTGG